MFAIAVFDYKPDDHDEIQLRVGDIVEINERYDDGWWMVKNGSVIGLAPSNYLELAEKRPAIIKPKPAELNVEAFGKPVAKIKDPLDFPDELPELKELQSITMEANAKISALRSLIKSGGDEVNDGLSVPSEVPLESNVKVTKVDEKAPLKNRPLKVATHEEAAAAKEPKEVVKPAGISKQVSNVPQVALDPSSLSFISNVINERIQKEFSERDNKLMEQVRQLLLQQQVSLQQQGRSVVKEPTKLGQIGRGDSERSVVSELPPKSRNSRIDELRNNSKIPRFHLPKVGKSESADDTLQIQRSSGDKLEVRSEPALENGNNHMDSNFSSLSNLQEKRQFRESKLPQLVGKKGRMSSAHKGGETAQNDNSLNLPVIDPGMSPLDQAIKNHRPVARHFSEQGIQYPQCRSVVYGPSNEASLSDNSIPTHELQLQHIYGYDGNTTVTSNAGTTIKGGRNILILSDHRIAFPAAAVVVVMDTNDRSQSFFCGHTDGVTHLTLHPNKTLIASCQHGKEGRNVLIWDSTKLHKGSSNKSMYIEVKIARAHANANMRGVAMVNFSGDGRFLLCLVVDESHSLIVYDWRDNEVIASAKVGHIDVHQLVFNSHLFLPVQQQFNLNAAVEGLQSPKKGPKQEAGEAPPCMGCYTIVSYGGKNVKFWALREVLVANGDNDFDDVSSFRGRKLAGAKKRDPVRFKYVLEGSIGQIASKGNPQLPEFTSIFMSRDRFPGSNPIDGEEDPAAAAFLESRPRSRIFLGTSVGSIYIWQHLEDNQAFLRNCVSWQGKGKLLTVVTDVHENALILDMAYISIPAGDGRHIQRILTSGGDGIVNLWKISSKDKPANAPLEHIDSIDLGASAHGAVRSVTWDDSGKYAVLGSKENSILQWKYQRPPKGDVRQSEDFHDLSTQITELHHAHSSKVKRVAVNGKLSYVVATISNDCTIRLWHCFYKHMLGFIPLHDEVSAVAFTADGGGVCVGNEAGEIVVFQSDTFLQWLEDGDVPESSLCSCSDWVQVMKRSVAVKSGTCLRRSLLVTLLAGAQQQQQEGRKKGKKHEVLEIKYSPSGDTVALGCRDNLIHILAAYNGYRHVAICRGHSTYIRNIDFSEDGAMIRSTDAAREVLHWDVASGQKISNASVFRDAAWHTHSCVYGWAMQGVFNLESGSSGGSSTNADNEVNCVARSSDAKLAVVGATHPKLHNVVKLFEYPCLAQGIPSIHIGHKSAIQDVAFVNIDQNKSQLLQSNNQGQKAGSYSSNSGRYMIVSAGGNDCSVIQWRSVKKL